MLRLTEIVLPVGHDDVDLRRAVLGRLGIAEEVLRGFTVFRRAVDARRKSAVQFTYTIDADVADEAAVLERAGQRLRLCKAPDMTYKPVRVRETKARPVVIGTGPCGIFAALILAEAGLRPIILERGKLVRERTKDTWALWRRGVLTPESNVQFGEGGAGTFSDGKLYSQISDPNHLGRKVLTEFVAAGAPPEILYVARPHIGTFRLVGMVETIRTTIERMGGEYRFGSKMTDLIIQEASGLRQLRGVILEDGQTIAADYVVLAIGHSARDTFVMLRDRGVYLQPKPFSIGVRVEHPQSMIDRARYGKYAGNPMLGAADYKLVHHASNGRTVYSFCMCPGGTVVAATSEPGHVVTNGMSQYSRNERNANAALVVGVTPADYQGDVLAGMLFQRELETRAYVAGGATYCAPAQLLGDFCADRSSVSFGAVLPSYKPGVTLGNLASCLPTYATEAIREALPVFGRMIPGFDRDDAVLTGVETRTSSPVRITRGQDGQSRNTIGLFPAGEGAGYAGGILSAGVDGIRVAEAVIRSIANRGS